MRSLLNTALKDSSLLPLKCCGIPIDMIVTSVLSKQQSDILQLRTAELNATRKMYCPTCSSFINLDFLAEVELLAENDQEDRGALLCDCGTFLCSTCGTASHPGLSCTVNKACQSGNDGTLLQLASEQGWKQCPRCAIMIEFTHGCNHMRCRSCHHDFCYLCLHPWDTARGLCSTGACDLWDDDRLEEAAENRVLAIERYQGAAFGQVDRQRYRDRAREALLENEACIHEWERQALQGVCERCGFDLYCYGMVCEGGCGSTVCYTCAFHRIPNRGWH